MTLPLASEWHRYSGMTSKNGHHAVTTIVDDFIAKFHPKHVTSDQFKDPNDVILFHHIPKAAGTSVGAGVQRVADVFHTLPWDDVAKSFVRATNKAIYDRTVTPQRQVIMGHFRFQETNFWRNNRLPIKAACIVRDPLERFVSQYNYNCSTKHPAHEKFKAQHPTMLDYARTLQNDFQLRYLLGPFFDFEDALGRLVHDFTFLGCVEHLDASMQHFSRSHGFAPIKAFNLNTGVKKTSKVVIDDKVRKLILSKSHNDLKFHKLVSDLYA